jgi:gamma-glutamyltranspeptidase/glutathione hydrolase
MRKYIKKCIIIPVICILLSFFLYSCSVVTVEKLYRNGVVATSTTAASRIGLEVLKNGGNAFDAAVAVGFALAVSHPKAGNIGGGGFALVYSAESGDISALDFRETAPLNASRDMYLDSDGEVIQNSSTLGAKAAGVPGTVAGLFELWKKYGSADWLNLVEYARKLADTGIIVDEHLADDISKYKNEK